MAAGVGERHAGGGEQRWSPELQTNIALCWVPHRLSDIGTKLTVEVPEAYCEQSGKPVDAVVV